MIDKPSIDAVLRKHNLTIDDLILCGKRGLNAKKVIKDRDGDFVEELDDFNVQHKFFASFMLMLGYLKESSVSVNVAQISTEERDLMDAYRRVVNSVKTSGSTVEGDK